MVLQQIPKILFVVLAIAQIKSKPAELPNTDNHPEIPRKPTPEPSPNLHEIKNSSAAPEKIDTITMAGSECKILTDCSTCNWHQINELQVCNLTGFVQTFECKNLGHTTRPCLIEVEVTNFMIFGIVVGA